MATALLSSRTDSLSFSVEFGTLSLLSVHPASPVLLTSTGPLWPSILRPHLLRCVRRRFAVWTRPGFAYGAPIALLDVTLCTMLSCGTFRREPATAVR